MSLVNVIDSIVITAEKDSSKILAEWGAIDPDIKIYSELESAQAVKLYLNWSDKNGTINLRQGDYFTFGIPDIFDYIYVQNVTDVNILSELGEGVATYSIYDSTATGLKEVKISFTDYVETHANISGIFWMLLFVGTVTSKEDKTLEFVINGIPVVEGEVKVNPKNTLTPKDSKVGYSLPERNAGGYYIFEWIIYFNMKENTVSGFNNVKDFSFEDIIPAASPHIFLTDAMRQELGLSSTAYTTQIGEYTGADSYTSENRYPVFLYHYNSTDGNIWYNSIHWENMANGLTTAGIDGDTGLKVSDMAVADKMFSANLGTLTRPTAIRLYTIAAIKIAESALGDSEVVGLFKNSFKGSTGQDLDSSLTFYRFASGGSAQGITGDYSFTFTKTDEAGTGLAGALFSLFTTSDFSAGADRFVYSDDNGVVTFRMLPAGTYYIQETTAPSGYISDGMTYQAKLTTEGYEIYYGENYENNLSGQDNQIVNKLEYWVKPVSVTLTGTKNLIGRTLASRMFSFVVKDSRGAMCASGFNDANGRIHFSEIEFDLPGVYSLTVEETAEGFSGYTYDASKHTVTVTVADDGNGNLTTDVTYPKEGVVFNNGFTETVEIPCRCRMRHAKCRKNIRAQKIWMDNDNAIGSRPSSVEIVLIRDGEKYKTATLTPDGNWAFTFACVPVWKNSGEKYEYKIDETTLPDGYSKSIDGYNITNTLIAGHGIVNKITVTKTNDSVG